MPWEASVAPLCEESLFKSMGEVPVCRGDNGTQNGTWNTQMAIVGVLWVASVSSQWLKSFLR